MLHIHSSCGTAVDAESKIIFAFKTCWLLPGLLRGNATTPLSISWRLSSKSFCSSGFQQETCACVWKEEKKMLSTEQRLFLVSVCRWPAAQLCADMMTASKVDDASNKSESSVCKSVERWELSMFQCWGASLVFIIPNRENQRKETFSLLCTVPASSHIETRLCMTRVVSLPFQHCNTLHFSIQLDW